MTSQKFSPRIALQFLGETNIFISITAALSSFSAFAFFGFPGSSNLSLAIFFSSLFTYNAQRLIGDLQKRETFRNAKKGLSILAFLAAPFFIFQLGVWQIAVLAIAGAISLGYALPVIPGKSGLQSLRKIPRLKIWLIAVVWILVIAVVPLIDISQEHGSIGMVASSLYMAQQGLLVLALTIPFDVRDLEVDDADQKTLPMVLGVRRSLRLAQVLIAFFTIPAFICYYLDYCSFWVFLAQVVVAAIGFLLIPKARKKASSLFFLIILDGLLLLQAVLVVGVQAIA